MADGHRKDIDGLRAVAILPVLFYHASIWPFSGGYVGVDVFFVISGYLITGLILRAGAGFSLREFYDRRIRRILPALFAVLVCTCIAALFILLPDELESFGESLGASVLFGANLLYWQRDAAYFAADANQNPLLHIWSLAVEEQFYLFWPLLLIFLARFRRLLPWSIALLALASLVLALVYAQISPNAAFYLLPHRAWQLLAGAFLAVGAVAPPRHALTRNAIALAGFALVAAAMLLPGGAALYHPLNALGATLGTASILFAAEGGANAVSSMLATRVPVFIGNISYSLYLWHWPALVFARLFLNRDLAWGEALAVLAGAFAISVLSWKYVEQPVRRRKALWRGRPLSFPVAIAGGATLLAVAAVFILTQGLPSRVPRDVRAVDAEAGAPLDGRWCEIGDTSSDCLRGDPALTGEAVLWGDSHARALAPGLDHFAQRRGLRLRQITRPACAPLPGLAFASPMGAPYPRCQAFNQAALSFLLNSKAVRLVVLEARWEVYVNESRIRPTIGVPKQIADALDGLLSTLSRHGIAVVIVGDVPRFADAPAHCYGRERLFGRDPSPCMVMPRVAAMAEMSATQALIYGVARNHPETRTYFPRAALCDGAICHAFFAGQILYRDAHHLSTAGALRVGRAMDAALRNWPR